jgi:ubiquinone/menaquinone biosynthesis C-methylase UbiE
MVDLDPDVRAYYERGREAQRLRGGASSGPLEFVRTQELIRRFLAQPPLEILDVGGGTGIHATWLLDDGHTVELVEPVPAHVEQALADDPRLTAQVGDARDLPVSNATADVVLLLGPLYHLPRGEDRRRVLAEARRVLRPGGWLFAAGISRFSALLDLLVRADRIHEPGVLDVVERAVQTGEFRGAEVGLFTTAYFHRPAELVDEAEQAGFSDVEVFNIEGPGFLVADFEERWQDPGRQQAMLRAARLIERDPDMAAAASHLLAVGQAP